MHKLIELCLLVYLLFLPLDFLLANDPIDALDYNFGITGNVIPCGNGANTTSGISVGPINGPTTFPLQLNCSSINLATHPVNWVKISVKAFSPGFEWQYVSLTGSPADNWELYYVEDPCDPAPDSLTYVACGKSFNSWAWQTNPGSLYERVFYFAFWHDDPTQTGPFNLKFRKACGENCPPMEVQVPDMCTQPGICVVPDTTIIGGTPPYTIWYGDAGDCRYVEPPLCTDTTITYDVFVVDANGCVASTSMTVYVMGHTISNDSLACYGDNNGSATATATGGLPPYHYEWSNGETTPTITGLSAGDQTVTITDDFGCIIIDTITITEPPPLIAKAFSDNAVSCYGESDGTGFVIVTGGIEPYTLEWSDGTTTTNITGLSAGVYNITVTDANGCIATDFITISQPPALLAVSLQILPATCLGSSNGVATAVPSGGTPPYYYVWTSGETTATATGLGAGTNTVTVTDDNGCTATNSLTITQIPTLTSDATVLSNVDCNGSNTGSATVTTTGGTPGYNIIWSNGATTSIVNNFPAGTHQVTITDANGCQSVDQIIITEPPTLIAALGQSSPVLCQGGSNGVATVTVMGGTLPYTYIWSNGGTSPTISNLGIGGASVTITDANGCIATQSIVITQVPTLTASAIVVSNVTCNGTATGVGTASATGGTLPYNYQWSNGETAPTATSLSAGTNLVTVTDANGCFSIASIIVSQPPPLIAAIAIGSTVSCNNLSDGTATVTPLGGTTPYSYYWDNGETGPTASYLGTGPHTVTITDSQGCLATANVVMSQPPLLSGTLTMNPVQCFGECNGTATVFTTGGTPTYQFIWSTGQNTASIGNLCVGIYSVTVTDKNDCKFIRQISVTQPPLLVANTTVISNPLCNSSYNGSAQVITFGGTPPYIIQWDNGEVTPVATALNAGAHQVTVVDANGCTETSIVTLTNPPAIQSNIFTSNVSCYNGNNGTATIAITGGTPPFNFNWSNGGNTISINNLPAGYYQVTVVDANGCTIIDNATINQPQLIQLAVTGTSASCNGSNNGTGTVTIINGGTPPFTYLWDNGEVTATASLLVAGLHSVTVTDSQGCTMVDQITINQPNLLSSTTSGSLVSCFGDCDGTATVVATGGTPPYQFDWSNGQNLPVIGNLCVGLYYVTVTDINGCKFVNQVAITQPPPLVVNSILVSNPLCNSSYNGSAQVITNGGTSPYTIQWDNGEVTATATALNAGSHQVTVVDANGCTQTSSITLIDPPTIQSSIASSDVSCYNGSNGTATVTLTGGTPPFNYTWSNGGNTISVNNLPAGYHQVTVVDANGCTVIDNTTINQPPPIQLNVTGSATSCNGGNDGTGTATVISGGTPPFSYLWDNGEITPTASFLSAGLHIVTVTDSQGCKITGQTTISQPNLLAAVTSSVLVSCFGDCDGTASITATGGTPPYYYQWSNGQVTPTIINLCSGSYQVTITDFNGCSVNVSAFVGTPVLLTSTVTFLYNPSCNGFSDGSAQINAFGGSLPYIYQWTNGETTDIATALGQGTHTVTVWDANGCTTTSAINMQEPTALQIGTSATNVSCFGYNDGSISASATGGTPPYYYNWSNGTIGATASNLPAGSYIVTLTDANSCIIIDQVSITEPPELLVNVNATDVTCYGGSDGTATIQPVNGIPPFSYEWSNGEVTNPATNLSTGTHSVTVTQANGCEAIKYVVVNSNTPVGWLSITPTNVSCNGGNNGSATVVASGGTPPYNYVWSTIPTQYGPSIFGLSSGTYFVTAYDINGCASTPGSVFIADPLPMNLTIMELDPECHGDYNGSGSVSVGGGVPAYDYYWNIGQTTATATGLPEGSYSVTVIDSKGCSVTDSITLEDPDLLGGTVSALPVLCHGDPSGSISFDTVYGGVPPYTYSINGTDFWPGNVFTNVFGGDYTGYIMDGNGCIWSDQLTVYEPPAITVVIHANVFVIALGDSLQLTALVNSNDSISYQWSPSESLTCTDCPNPIAFPYETTTYTVVVTDRNGCPAENSVTIVVDRTKQVWVPNIFTPNQDGINDYVTLFGNKGVEKIQFFRIYDRWGEMVFVKENFDHSISNLGWNGYFRGRPMNPAVFVYYAKVLFKDGTTERFKGDITLVY